MVFMGCGSVAIAVLYYPLSLWQVALMWSLAVALAIYTVKGFSHAHLNPAVTLAMAITQKTKWLNVPMYFLAQLAGAVFASFVLYALINKDLQAFEHAQSLERKLTRKNQRTDAQAIATKQISEMRRQRP